MIAVLIGAVVNIVFDVYFVTILNKGLAGAATATAMSQIAGALYLLAVGIRKVRSTPSTGQQKSLKRILSMLTVPSPRDLSAFFSFCGPLFFVLLAKCVLWSYTTYASASGVTLSLAAHQITINFFLFFVIFGDAVSQMSQTFLPSFLSNVAKADGKGKN